MTHANGPTFPLSKQVQYAQKLFTMQGGGGLFLSTMARTDAGSVLGFGLGRERILVANEGERGDDGNRHADPGFEKGQTEAD